MKFKTFKTTHPLIIQLKGNMIKSRKYTTKQR